MRGLTILSPGLESTIQDLGRPGYAHLGISPSGAADALSLRIGNLLVGNSEGAAAVEMTIVGCHVRFEGDLAIALTGADMQPALDGAPLEPWRSYLVRPGQVLGLSRAASGCRSYLCVGGGIGVPPFLGSASTHLRSGLGGLEGRRLRKDDWLPIARTPRAPYEDGPRRVRRTVLDRISANLSRPILRVTEAVHSARFSDNASAIFFEGEYRVSPQSDRLGLRLEGLRVESLDDVPTVGVSLGTIQIAPDGQPTILFVEQQLTGGYPQIACVISADSCRIGQLRPGDIIRFEKISLDAADEAFHNLEALVSSQDLFEGVRS